jgi:hypothetical protein
MSHQDHGLPGEAAACLGDLRNAVAWLLRPRLFAEVHFRRDSRWLPWTVAAAALFWAWSAEQALTERFVTARELIKRLWPKQPQSAESYQAFLKLLRRWGATLLLLMIGHFQVRMQKDLAARFQVAGYVVFGVDGTRMELPRTASHEEAFGKGRARNKHGRQRRPSRRQGRPKKANGPQIWLTTLWHVGTGLPWDWRQGPSGASEREHLVAMIPGLPKGALVTADAGFVGYEYWATLLEAGCAFVIRVGANVKLLKKLGYARQREGLVYLWTDKAASQSKPPLVLRLVIVHNGKHPVYLVTSVLSAAKLSDCQVISIYRQRWGVEVFYRSFKQTFGRKKLRSHAAENAVVELDWSLAGLWAMCLYAQKHQPRRDTPPTRRSVAKVLRAFRRTIQGALPPPPTSLERQLRDALTDLYRRKDKTSRNYPRKKQETPAGAPTITTATRFQINQARQLKAGQLRLTA